MGSVCSGVGGFELGLHRADPRFDVRWMCEYLPQRRAILNRHWPDVAIHPDLKELDPDALDPIDLLVGGTPCQGLSVAGKRKGLEDERSGLFWHYIRVRNSLVPRWTLWENVPGALSSNEGLDFALVLGAFVGAQCHVPAGGWARSGVAAGPWGGAVWRTLNSQHFGVPQRRHRVFIVGHFGGPVQSEVLFERAGGAGDSRAGGQKETGASSGPRGEPKGAGSIGTPGGATQALTSRFGSSGPDFPDAEAGWLVADEFDVAPALTARYRKGVTSDADDAVVIEEGAPEVAAPLTRGSATGEGVSEPGRRQEDDVNLIAFDGTQRDAQPLKDMSPALRSGKGAAAPSAFEYGSQVRRLTPTECERLQGFPDGWTISEGPSLADEPSYYQLDARPAWEFRTFTKLHAANDEDDYESWAETDEARTLVDGRLNGTLVAGPVHSIRTSQTGANGQGVAEELAPTLDSIGAAPAVGPLEQADRIHDSRGVAPTLSSQEDRCGPSAAPLVTHALTSEGHDASEDGTGRGTPLVADQSPTLRSNPRNNSHPPTEADMLVAGGGVGEPFDPLPDAHRYAAMGDAVTVPVISFIGSRIAALEYGRNPDGA